MAKVIEGKYRAGKIELIGSAAGIAEETVVFVTFVETPLVDLRELGVSEAQAADARTRLASFAEDWDSPEMSIYDDYDAALRQQTT